MTATVTPLPRLPMTKALKTLIADKTAHPCEILTIPKKKVGNDWVAVKPPYTILYPLWTTYGGPPFMGGEADSRWVYQTTFYVVRGDQAEWFRDKLNAILIGRDAAGAHSTAITVAGMFVMDRESLDENSAGSASPDTKTGIMSYDMRFALTVTPT